MATPIYDLLYRINYSGQLQGGEIFDHGCWMTVPSTALDSDVITAAELWLTTFLASPALSVGASDIRHLFDPGVKWTRVTVRQYVIATGLPAGDPTDAVIAISGAGLGSWPAQDSLVVTLWNGRAIGRRKYNRFYLPPMETSALALTGRVFAGLPGDIGFGVAAGNAAMVALSVPASLVYYGSTHHEVVNLTEVHVDDIVDTQRRRRDQLIPVITPTAL